jgi:hypothetical protein
MVDGCAGARPNWKEAKAATMDTPGRTGASLAKRCLKLVCSIMALVRAEVCQEWGFFMTLDRAFSPVCGMGVLEAFQCSRLLVLDITRPLAALNFRSCGDTCRQSC